MSYAISVSKQVLVMALIALCGLAMKKTGKITDDMKTSASNLMMYLVSPIMVVNSFIRPFEKQECFNWLISLLLGTAVTVIFMGIAKVMFPDKDDPEHNGINRFAVVFSNAGFIGIPLVQASLGVDGVFYMVGFIAASGLFMWSTGAKDISGGKYQLNLKNILITPTMLGTYAGLFIYLLQLPLGVILTDTIGYISNLNTALSMIFIGLLLADVAIKDLFNDMRIMKVALARLIICPLAVIVVGFALNLIFPQKYILIIMTLLVGSAAPSASATAMMSNIFGNDDVYAGKVVSTTTVLCILTIPLSLLLAGLVIK